MLDSNDTKYISLKGEILRKTTHLLAFFIPAGYYFLNLSKPTFLTILAVMAVISISIDLARIRNWKFWHYSRKIIAPFLRVSEIERGDFSGATYILTAAWLTAALFSKPIFFAALCFIIFGDPLSALVGRFYGRHRFRNKSFEGSSAFLMAALVVALLAPELPFPVLVFGAVVATVTEAVSSKIDDNVTVPLMSGLCMMLMLKMFY